MGARVIYYNINSPSSITYSASSIAYGHASDMVKELTSTNFANAPRPAWLFNKALQGGETIYSTWSYRGWYSQTLSNEHNELSNEYVAFGGETNSRWLTFIFIKDYAPAKCVVTARGTAWDGSTNVYQKQFTLDDMQVLGDSVKLVVDMGEVKKFSQVVIQFTETQYPNQRAELHHFAYGIIYDWNGDDLVSCEVVDNVSPSEICIGTSKVQAVCQDVVNFKTNQYFDIYHYDYPQTENDTLENAQFIRRDYVNRFSRSGKVLTIDGQDCIYKLANKYIDNKLVNKRFDTQGEFRKAPPTLYNFLTQNLKLTNLDTTKGRYMSATISGGFNERVTLRDALLNVACGTGNVVYAVTGDYDQKGKIKVLNISDLNVSPNLIEIEEDCIYNDLKITENSQIDCTSFGLNWFTSAPITKSQINELEGITNADNDSKLDDDRKARGQELLQAIKDAIGTTYTWSQLFGTGHNTAFYNINNLLRQKTTEYMENKNVEYVTENSGVQFITMPTGFDENHENKKSYSIDFYVNGGAYRNAVVTDTNIWEGKNKTYKCRVVLPYFFSIGDSALLLKFGVDNFQRVIPYRRKFYLTSDKLICDVEARW